MLWPLGGVAFVQPPPRPGALLWSIVAGPLVNVILLPPTVLASVFANSTGFGIEHPDFAQFLFSIALINFGLLVFNLLPIYPLDGGQILQALLWFVIGQARSLMVAAIIGLAVATGVIVLALMLFHDQWMAVMALFVGWQAWRGFRMGFRLHRLQPTIEMMNQGLTAVRAGRDDDAVELFTRVIDGGGEPDVLATALANRALVESRRKKWQRAIDDYREALRLQPKLAAALNSLAWLLAASPVAELRNGHEAVELATSACNATGWGNANCLATLAAAWAELGDFAQAVHWHKRALEDPAYRQALGEATASERLRQYEQGLPYRLPATGAEARPFPPEDRRRNYGLSRIRTIRKPHGQLWLAIFRSGTINGECRSYQVQRPSRSSVTPR